MKCKIEILPAAWEDLKQIEDWYLVQFGVETALKVTDSILAAVERLAEFPDSWLNQSGYRMIICKKHVAVYRRIENVVYLYHIADTQTEYTKLFYS